MFFDNIGPNYSKSSFAYNKILIKKLLNEEGESKIYLSINII